VPGLWTDLESLAAVTAAKRLAAMTTRTDTVIDDLRELIAALDRRVPHLEREGERAIARDAADLRAAAINRLRALEQPSWRHS
jgi:hypothetical protein